MPLDDKMRLDQLMVEKFGYDSRSRARDAVLRGCVFLDGKKLSKPGQVFPREAELDINDEAGRYVSRAALKLAVALEAGEIDIRGAVALDLGASTGGFVQVLLENGAAKVFAVDVGTGQLHPSLCKNSKVVNIENLNVRVLDRDDLGGEAPTIVTSDLSFISLKLALPPALRLAADNAFGVFLIKPQFEVGKAHVGGGGIVRDDDLVKRTVEDLTHWLDRQSGWRVITTLPSPIAGGNGNREFLMIARKDVPDVG